MKSMIHTHALEVDEAGHIIQPADVEAELEACTLEVEIEQGELAVWLVPR
ncbi:hypothetical protein [Aneurinibacillus migulanus]|uniref:Uncharacterized protein n=1 Tax=Aneurinibacillus migulanus TaxID=47500 RepID=A0A1G8PSQ6_ANEMI|nr:hypothetical protein [Aneurinibacillus migulanus]MCP1354837.1 hypothetical protein [Aneurinibacillus migulanus]MED0892751.1 hypothetical protein [Aneurinibacillus migulanus]MED1618997.1 hypothetical protein [Aneurinibacillus migulanus]MED4729185.1 hypothetical protein [Aneurinibacillus migulanus]SDI95511.1 hypothetical protein SAMN04487909_109216 [Aneurinibacillus migulanus]